MRGTDIALGAAAALALAGCASADRGPTLPGSNIPARDLCDPQPAQVMLGQKASSQTGQRILQLTGAKQLRWLAPNSQMTMDLRADRVNVFYDQSMTIEMITCG